MLHALSDHIEEVAALILFGIGFSNLLLNRHMMKKIIGFFSDCLNATRNHADMIYMHTA